MITPQENTQARPRPIQASMENLVVQEHAIFWDEYTSSHESIEYHQFAFPVPKPQGENPTMNTEEPQDAEDTKR